jgi:hypothetical protein
VTRRAGGWNLSDFDEQLDLWQELAKPSDDVRLLVTAWVLSRIEDPYQGLRREPDGHPQLWFGMAPGSRRGYGAVYCSCLIFEQTGTVRCNSITTLSWPA